jgi:hypothetical protein
MTDAVDVQEAREIIRQLKAGTLSIEYVKHLNVGNERWYEAAGEYFDDLQNTGDSLVRFIKGYYGDGKTHFLGMLRAIAFSKKWIVSYITAEKTPLNRFDTVYSEIVKNIAIPPMVDSLVWVISREARGPRSLLGAVFSKICLEAYRPGDITALKKPTVVEFLKTKFAELAYEEVMEESVGKALRGYVEAVITQDNSRIQDIITWLQGGQTKIPELGITKPIGRVTSRDAMRSISVIARRAGISGILVLVDEAERIMKQSKPVRTSSYGIIRDLLDNADEQGGMHSSIMYIAGTPEMFSDEKGFAENDALRSRLDISGRFAINKYPDYRSVIVDLTKTPLTHELMVQLAHRIRGIHAIARNWNSEKQFTSKAIEEIVNQVEQGVFQISKPRMLSASIATLLDTAEQNRDVDIIDLISQILNQVHSALPKEPKSENWE